MTRRGGAISLFGAMLLCGCHELLELSDYDLDQGAAGGGGVGGVSTVGGGGSGGSGGSVDWGLLNWGARIPVTVTTTFSNEVLSGFHLPIALTIDSSIRARMLDEGQDVRVTDADGVSELPRDVERLTNTELDIWVRFETLDPATLPRQLYVYFDNDSAGVAAMTWPDHAAVYHFNEPDNAPLKDSSGNAKPSDGAGGAPRPTSLSARMGQGMRFEGGGEYKIKHDFEFINESFTVSAWVRSTASPPAGRQVFIFNGGVDDMGYALTWEDGGRAGAWVHDGTSSSVFRDIDNTWHLLALVTDVALNRMFLVVNGVETDLDFPAQLLSIENATHDLSIGLAGSYMLEGEIDEVRLARGLVPFEHFLAEYEMLKDAADAYLDVGDLEDRP